MRRWAALIFLLPGATLAGDAEYGAYLAGECTGCHAPDGAHGEIPWIVGWAPDAFETALREYRDKTRPHPAMQMIAGRLGDEEIAALAAYFGSLEP